VYGSGVLLAVSDANDPIVFTRGSDGNTKINGADPTSGGLAPAASLWQVSVIGGPGGSWINAGALMSAGFPAIRGVTVDGNGGNATLVGPDQVNTWNLTGTDSGTLDTKISFQRVPNLTGGANTDNFVYQGGRVTGVIDGGDGALNLTSSGVLPISNNVLDRADISIQAKTSITVDPGATISSRRTAGGDPATALSTGPSGKVTFTAPQITLGNGSKVLAFATAGFTAGDIAFTATDNTGVTSLISTTTQATVQLNGATIRGKDVTVAATTDSKNQFSDFSQVVPVRISLLDSLLSRAGAAITNATSNIVVGPGSMIEAANLSLLSTAQAETTVKTTSSDLSFAYGETHPTALITVADGTTIRTSGDFKVNSRAHGKADVNAENKVEGDQKGNELGLTLAISDASLQSVSQIGRQAAVTVGGNLEVKALMDQELTTDAKAGAYQEGSVGFGVALSRSTSDVEARVDGNVSVTKDITIEAEADASKGGTTADASVGATQKRTDKVGKAQDLGNKVKDFFGQKKPPIDTRSGGSTSALAISASFAYVDHSNQSTAAIADNAQVASKTGNITVHSVVTDVPAFKATSSISSNNINKKENALSAAVIVSHNHNTNNASIGAGATVNANKALTVSAETRMPAKSNWFNLLQLPDLSDPVHRYQAIINDLKPKFDALSNRDVTTWAKSSATGDKTALAGTVVYTTFDNATTASINPNARINQDPALRSPDQEVTVTATNLIEAVNLSGFGGATGGSAGVGGSYLGMDYQNTANALIQNGAQVQGADLAVKATNTLHLVDGAEAGSKAGKFAIAGAFTLAHVTNQTLAQVDAGATVTTGSRGIGTTGKNVQVAAQDDAFYLTVDGGVVRGANVGIGFSVGINEITRNTQAVLGNQVGQTAAGGTVNAGGDVAVEANSKGLMLAASLAAAIPGGDGVDPSQKQQAPNGQGGFSGSFGISISGDVALNTATDTTEAAVRGAKVTINNFRSLTVAANENTGIDSLAGAVTIVTSGGSSVGLAGSYSQNTLRLKTHALVDNSTLGLGKMLQVAADSAGAIRSITASGSVTTGSNSVGAAGSVSINRITDSDTTAAVTGASANASQAEVTARDHPLIWAVAGAVGYGGKAALGASVGLNIIDHAVKATVSGSDVWASVGSVAVSAKTDDEIKAVTATLSATPGNLAASVSVSLNTITNEANASISGTKTVGTIFRGIVAANGAVTATSTDNSSIQSLIGSVALVAGNGVGIGASVGKNDVTNQALATAEGTRLYAATTVDLAATSTAQIDTIAAGGAVSQSAAGSGAVTVNTIRDTIDAHVAGNTLLEAGSAISVSGKDSPAINSLAGAVAGGGRASAGATAAYNDIGNHLSAYIDGSSVGSGDSLTLSGSSKAKIKTASATGAAAGTVSGAGSSSLNQIHNSQDVGVKNGADVGAYHGVSLSANDESTIDSLAGAVSGAGTGTLSASVAKNDIGTTLGATVDDARVRSDLGGLTASATSKATINSIAAAGAGGGTVAGGGSVTLNKIANTLDAHVAGKSNVVVRDDVALGTSDTSTIQSIGAAVTVGGTGAFGAGVATNDIGNTLKASIDGAPVAGYSVRSGSGSVTLGVGSSPTIKTLSAGLSGSGTAAISGAVSLNKIHSTLDAHFGTRADVSALSAIGASAEDKSTIKSLSGQIAVGVKAGIGGAAAYNDIANHVKASVSDAKLTGSAGNVDFLARSQATIETIAAGGSGGIVGIAGSVAINLFKNDVEASVKSSTVTAGGSFSAVARQENNITFYGGSLGVGAVGIAGTGAVSVVSDTTKAFISNSSSAKADGASATSVPKADGSGVNEAIRGVAVVALTSETNKVITGTAALGLGFGFAASVSVDVIHNDTEAYVDGSAVGTRDAAADARHAVVVRAFDATGLNVTAGALQASSAVGFGATSDTTIAGNTTKAYFNNAVVDARRNVEVNSVTRETLDTLTVAGSFSGYLAVAGSVPVVKIDGTTEAAVIGSTVSSRGNLTVHADDATDVRSRAGGLGVGFGGLGVGVSAPVTLVSHTTKAHISDSTTNASGTTAVTAQSKETTTPYAVTIGLGLGAGVAGSILISTVETTTLAYIDEQRRPTSVNQDPSFTSTSQDVTVSATDTVRVDTSAGTIGAGLGAGVGASVEVSTVKNTVSAYLGSGVVVDAGRDISVSATSDKDLHSRLKAGAGGLLFGAAASVSIINIGSPLSNDGGMAAKDTGSNVNNNFRASPLDNPNGKSALGDSDQATRAKSKSDTERRSLSVAAEFDKNAHPTDATTASVGAFARVRAGRNLSVSDNGTTHVDVSSGTLGIGLGVGAGGGVGLVSLNSRTNAFVGQHASLSARGDISVAADGRVTKSKVDGWAGGAGMLVGIGADYARLNSTNSASAYLDTGAAIDRAGNVTVAANTASDIKAHSYGLGVGIVAVGIALANASENGTTQAYLGRMAKVGNVADPNQAVGSLTIRANSTVLTDVSSEASAAGIISGDGSKADANAAPTVQAFLDRDATARVAGGTQITADVSGYAWADAKGANEVLSGAHVGRSYATANWRPSEIAASVKGNTVLVSGGNVLIRANQEPQQQTICIPRLGCLKVDLYVASAKASASAGALLLGSANTEANAHSEGPVQALVESRASVTAGNITISSFAGNVIGTQTGEQSGGFVGEGWTTANTYANPQVSSYVGEHSTLTAVGDIKIDASSNQNISVNAYNSNKGVGSTGGNEINVTDYGSTSAGPQFETLGSDTLTAGGTVEIKAQSQWDRIDAQNNGDSGGFISYAGVTTNVTRISSTMALLPSHAVVRASELDVTALRNDDYINVFERAVVNAAGGNCDAGGKVRQTINVIAGDYGSVDVTAPHGVKLYARAERVVQIVDASAAGGFLGLRAGHSHDTADSTLVVHPLVSAGSGSTYRTNCLDIQSAVLLPPLWFGDQRPPANFAYWPYVDTHRDKQLYDGYYRRAFSADSDDDEDFYKGSLTLDPKVVFNANVVVTAAMNPELAVDANGNVVKAVEVKYHNYPGEVDVNGLAGSTMAPCISIIAQVDLPNRFERHNWPPVKLFIFNYGDGVAINPSITGSPHFDLKSGFDSVTITNDSSKRLVINDLDMLTALGAGNPTVHIANILRTLNDQSRPSWVEHDGPAKVQLGRGFPQDINIPAPGFKFSASGQGGPGLLVIRNHTGSDIILAGVINNPGGITQVSNTGGNFVLGTGRDSFNPTRRLVTSGADLRTDRGTIGTAAVRLPVWSAQNFGVYPSLTATGNAGVYLDLTYVRQDNRLPEVPNVTALSPAGTVDLLLRDGILAETNPYRLWNVRAARDVRVYANRPGLWVRSVVAGGTAALTTVFGEILNLGTSPVLVAASAVLRGGVGIGGFLGFLSTQVGILEGSAGPNGFLIANTGPLVVTRSTDLQGIQSTGRVLVKNSGPLTVTGDVVSTSEFVSLTTVNGPGRMSDLTVASSGTVSALGGEVTLDAYGNVSLMPFSVIAARNGVEVAGGGGGRATLDILGRINAPMANIFAFSDFDTVNLARGADTTPTTVIGLPYRNDTINVRNNGGPLTVQKLTGPTTINVSSMAGLPGNPPGVVDGIVGPVTVLGSGRDTLNVSDTASIVNKSGTLTDTRLTGLRMGQGITYSGLTNLNIYLGSGNDTFAINEINPPTTTLVDGGPAFDRVTASFRQDFQGNLTLVGFEAGTVSVNRDFVGTLTDRSPGNLDAVTIGRSLTASGTLTATGNVGILTVGGIVNNRAVPGDVVGRVSVGGNLDLAYIYGSLSGQVAVGGNVTYILEVFGNLTGGVQVTKDVAELSVLGSQSGSFGAGGNVTLLEIGAGLTRTGTVRVGGDLWSLRAGSDSSNPGDGLFGQVVVAGNLFQLQTFGALTGTVAVGGDVGMAFVDGGDIVVHYGGLIVDGLFSGQLVALGNVYGDLWVKGDLTGRIAVKGHPVPGLDDPQRFGILGNVEVDGWIGPNGAIFSGGLIGDAAGGTALSATGVAGILAAKGDISLGAVDDMTNARMFAQASGVNAVAIDAIFADQGRPLTIDTTPRGLNDLALILADLASLHVDSNGNLKGLRP
jgi:hypothetical protein